MAHVKKCRRDSLFGFMAWQVLNWQEESWWTAGTWERNDLGILGRVACVR